MNTVGRHLIVEFYDCDATLLDDVRPIRAAMLGAANCVGASVVGETFHRFSPQGVSGSVVIAESHLSIHTWPARGYVAVDIFTCGGLDPRPGLDFLAEQLGAHRSRFQEIVRGLPEDIEEGRPFWPDDVEIINRVSEPRTHGSRSR
jgi:S-adenosylmethionine decarboxylase proenzyme